MLHHEARVYIKIGGKTKLFAVLLCTDLDNTRKVTLP